MWNIGGPELILILVLALIVFGPRKLPEIGKSMGKMLGEFRRASNDFKRTIEEEVEAEKRVESSAAAVTPAAIETSAEPPAGTVAQTTAAPDPSGIEAPAPERSAPDTPATENATPLEHEGTHRS